MSAGLRQPPVAAQQVGDGAPSVTARLATLNWQDLAVQLDARGYAVLPELLDAAQCTALAARYADPEGFRSRVVMARCGFGRGEYRYFSYPLPPLVAELREALYPPLAGIANRWHTVLHIDTRYPLRHADYLERCHRVGQSRPTPLLLQYGVGDYNCLHQDLYGDLVFPLQMVVLLSDPARDFTGGEFLLVEQRPRAQSRAEIVPLCQGEAAIFPVHHRPARGTRGAYRLTVRHGVSRVRSGDRQTLGIIFHDAA